MLTKMSKILCIFIFSSVLSKYLVISNTLCDTYISLPIIDPPRNDSSNERNKEIEITYIILFWLIQQIQSITTIQPLVSRSTEQLSKFLGHNNVNYGDRIILKMKNCTKMNVFAIFRYAKKFSGVK